MGHNEISAVDMETFQKGLEFGVLIIRHGPDGTEVVPPWKFFLDSEKRQSAAKQNGG